MRGRTRKVTPVKAKRLKASSKNNKKHISTDTVNEYVIEGSSPALYRKKKKSKFSILFPKKFFGDSKKTKGKSKGRGRDGGPYGGGVSLGTSWNKRWIEGKGKRH